MVAGQETLVDQSDLEQRILTSEQIERIRQLLQRASGSLVLDDQTDGDGAVVATLSNGRHLVTLSVPLGTRIDPATEEANAELFCHARYIIARLLRDREALLEENARLRQRLTELEGLVRDQMRRSDSLSAARPR